MACILKNVISSASGCKENPAGLSNYCMVVPLDSDHVATIGVNDAKNQYVITVPGGAGTGLKGFRIDFKGQTGQVASEDNGGGKGWTVTGTGRVEKNTDDMAYVSRILSNMDGKYLVFFPTGNIASEGTEWIVVGNPFGDSEFNVTSDTGAARGDDHGQTFQVVNSYQLYPEMKWYGSIAKEEDPTEETLFDDTTDGMVIGGGAICTLTAESEDETKGTVIVAEGQKDTYVTGDRIRLRATPKSGYRFGYWTHMRDNAPAGRIYASSTVQKLLGRTEEFVAYFAEVSDSSSSE